MIDKKTKEYFFRNPDVTSVSYGFKYTAGVKTNVRCLVIGVKKKVPSAAVRPARMIPRTYAGQMTDVQEKNIWALSLVARMRPCPPGFSVGHTTITAGTLGAYVKKNGNADDWWILSNNHVLAASNQGKVNDTIIQPGRADGGSSTNDRLAWLKEFVTINWDNGNGNGNGNGCNIFARMWMRLKGIQTIEQPYPNLVDAALALPVNQGHVNRLYPKIDTILSGIAEVELGDGVIKVGRTTEDTYGQVEGVDARVRVQYDGGTATFDDQIEIRAIDGGEFSAGGDSGSAILAEGGTKMAGLLFAGGSGVTIANPIGHVVDLLKISV